MNPRILKKLSKRADAFVSELTNLTRFEVNKDHESIDSSQCVEYKYRERWNGKPNEHGYFIPLKGTVGYGEVSGYYEPEWEENDAYSILQGIVINHFTNWSDFDVDEGKYPCPVIDLSTPKAVFANAPAVMNFNTTAYSQ